MRITHKFNSQNIKSNLSKRSELMETAWRHVSTGKRVERPSDDPAAVSRILSYRSLLSEVDQRRFQAEQGMSVLTAAETAMGEAGEIVSKAQDLALASGSGSANPEDIKIMGVQVDQLLAQLNDVANKKYDDRTLFASGGSLFSASDMSGLQLSRDSVFGSALSALEKLKNELSSGNRASDATISDLKTGFDDIISNRTQVGARTNRLERKRSGPDR
jgi:flagellar hook-associated protein 3 FlgL